MEAHSLVSCAVDTDSWASRSPVVRYWLTCGLLMNMFKQNKRWVIPFVVSV